LLAELTPRPQLPPTEAVHIENELTLGGLVFVRIETRSMRSAPI
jgi:hypothetical protein